MASKICAYIGLTASDSSEKRASLSESATKKSLVGFCLALFVVSPNSGLNNVDKGMRHSNWLAWVNVPSPISPRGCHMIYNPIRKSLSFSGSFSKEKG